MWKAKVNGGEAMEVSFEDKALTQGTMNGKAFELDLIQGNNGSWNLLMDKRSWTVDVLSHDKATKTVTLLVNGQKCEVELKDKFDALLAKLGMDNLAASAVQELKAPMPGLVLDIHVQPGDVVKKGDVLLILEAMKMENVLKSPSDAVIGSIAVEKGLAVEKNQVLVHFE